MDIGARQRSSMRYKLTHCKPTTELAPRDKASLRTAQITEKLAAGREAGSEFLPRRVLAALRAQPARRCCRDQLHAARWPTILACRSEESPCLSDWRYGHAGQELRDSRDTGTTGSGPVRGRAHEPALQSANCDDSFPPDDS